MTYRLWIEDLDCGVAVDEHAVNWMEAIRKRYPDTNVRIEAAPDATPTFPVGEEEERDAPDPSSITRATCPHCGAVRTFPGFEVKYSFVCRECGEGVTLSASKQ